VLLFCLPTAATFLPFYSCLSAGETQEDISARKVQHSWGCWLKQDGSDASEQTGGGCEQEADDAEDAGCCAHKHHHHEQQEGADADSGKQEQVGGKGFHARVACACALTLPCILPG
jgi:hypothetical protein